MADLIKRILPFLVGLGLANGCLAGWLNPSQPGYVIQTFTSYEPISGNNSGTITTNGNSYQFAGDNTGSIYIGGPGSQFRGKNDGTVRVDGDGSFVLGTFASLAEVTNRGKGSLLLGNLSAGQKALITDVGNASILLGAGTVSNGQAIVVGDGNVSHGIRSVTADSFWGMGGGFFGDGSGLTMPAFSGFGTTGTVSSAAGDAGKFLKAEGGWGFPVMGGALAMTNDTGAKIEVGGLAIGQQNLGNVGDRSLLLGAYGNAMGQWSFGGGYFPKASHMMSFVWEGVGGAYESHGFGTFNIRSPSIWFDETKVWDESLGFLLPVPAGNVTGTWTNPVACTSLTVEGHAVSWKTNVWWAYATSDATELTAFTNIYLGR